MIEQLINELTSSCIITDIEDDFVNSSSLIGFNTMEAASHTDIVGL